ncbi:MAG: O-antigen ligase family protein [Clostridia bacterium]|nr:O-antigen ligase family protein [Clostridia bacterium]
MSKFAEKFDTGRLKSYFLSKYYPPTVAVLTLLTWSFGLEFYLFVVNLALMCVALCVCDTVTPLIMPFITIIYNVSIKNSPGHPTFSDYYFTSWRLPLLIIMIAAFVISLVVFMVKNRVFSRISVKDSVLLIPLFILSAAFALNGIFSKTAGVGNLIFGLSQAFAFLFIYLYIRYGFAERETTEELGSYLAFISSLTSLVLVGEMAVLYLTGDGVFEDGSIVKEAISLGWGVWNPVGVCIAVLIPMNFYGAMKSSHPFYYFTTATLTALAAVMTMSRNAMIAAIIFYATCVLISSFVGEHKRKFRIVTAVGAVLLVLFLIVFREKIAALLSDYLERGLSDNGRFELWQNGISAFLENPIFGVGFFGVPADTFHVTDFMPNFSHQTFVELLAATGIVGLAAYLYYRVKSALPFFKRPTLLKTMLGLSILVLLVESLLDNFIFYIYPLVYYNTALAIVMRDSEEHGS